MDLWVKCITVSLLQGLCVLGPVTARPYKQKHAIFHSGHTIQDVYFTRDLLQDTGASRVGCASHCHMNPRCRSYFYNKPKHRCRTHSVIFSDDTGAVHEEGWEYYGRRGTGRKRLRKTSNVITTVAPGLDDTPKFAQNATTPAPITVDDDEDDTDDFEDGASNADTSSLQPGSRSPKEGKTPSSVTSTETESKSTREKTTANSPIDRTGSETNIGVTHLTASGSRVTIRRTDVQETQKSTPSSKGDSSTHDKSSATKDTTKTPSEVSNGINSGETTTGGTTDNSKPGRTRTGPDTTRSGGPEATGSTFGSTSGKKTGDVDTSNTAVPHDEELHDQLSFLTTQQQNRIIELSTGVMVPGGDDDDDDDGDDESVTIVVMVGDDDEGDDHDHHTSHMVTEKEMDTTVDVITLVDHTHIGDEDDDNDDGNFGLDILTGFPFPTDILGLTLGAESQHDNMADRETVIPDDTKQGVQGDQSQTTESVSDTHGGRAGDYDTRAASGSSWLGGGVAALGVLGVGVPLVGVGVYAVYRRRRTGSWTLLHRRDDGLGLQLISTE